jgi:hypothetical protein
MEDFSQVKPEMILKYVGDSLAFGGSYLVVTAESTYIDKESVPDDEKGKLVICEIINDCIPMFFTLDMLDPNDWEIEED